jgi:hypothetical protein
MIEVYVLLTLGALGYLLNKSTNEVKQGKSDVVNVNEVPSMRNVYDSKHAQKVDDLTRLKASKKFVASNNPKATGVINHNYQFMKDQKVEEKEQEMVRSLTGDYMNKNDFTHNNMVPYYGGSIKQNMDDKSNRVLLENFTGITDLQRNKCETASFYDKTKDVTNVNGMQNKDDFYRDRLVMPTARNNEFPIPQIHVGPGLGLGYDSAPSGGFQQFDVQDFVQDKCVDELRTKLNPNPKALGATDRTKQTFASRTVDGLKTGLRGDVGAVAKNRADTWFEQTPDMWFKTTGANLKPTKYGKFNVKDTNRLTTTKQHIGSAYASSQLARTADPNVRRSSRQQFKSPSLGGAALSQYGIGTKYDYGKSRILVYNNERDVTSTRVYQGNLTSLIKAIVAPIEDMIKITKKQHTVDNPRHFGNISMQIPKKPTIYDPSDVAKTTIKETTIHDAILGNLKGHEKITVHDPDDLARTTLKETTIHDAILGNLKGHEKQTVYDPNDIARTTIKETLIHDEIGTGTLTGPKQLYIYDPDEIAKKTIRETLDRMDYEMNMAAKVYKGKVYDPNDPARTTIKETTVDRERLFGNINAYEGGGGYETNEYDAKDTQKQFLSDYDYYGVARNEKGEGYLTNEYDAKDTQKQFLSDIEYFGVADSTDKKQTSYEDMYNASITENKEVTLFGREPTQTGRKVFNDSVNMAPPRKQQCDNRSARAQNNSDKVYNAIPSFDAETLTRTRKNFDIEQDSRLDISLLDAFRDNPYTQPLDSVA